MITTLTMGEARVMATDFLNNWESEKNKMQLSGPAMYNLIAVKKELEKHIVKIQETVSTLASAAGGELQDNGSYRIPEDKVEELNQKLAEFNSETLEIEYSPIKLRENDYLPPVFMDALFNFIELN